MVLSTLLTLPSSTVVEVEEAEEEEEEEEEEKGSAHSVRPYMAVREKPESMKKRGMMAEAVLWVVGVGGMGGSGGWVGERGDGRRTVHFYVGVEAMPKHHPHGARPAQPVVGSHVDHGRHGGQGRGFLGHFSCHGCCLLLLVVWVLLLLLLLLLLFEPPARCCCAPSTAAAAAAALYGCVCFWVGKRKGVGALCVDV